MDFSTRQDLFIKTVQKKVGATKEWKLTQLFGVSNRAILIEGALQIGAGNLNSWSTVPPGAILASVIRFPPADEIYFAVIIEHDCDKLLQRLSNMKQRGTLLKEQAAKYGKEPKRNTSSRHTKRQEPLLENSIRQEDFLGDLADEDENSFEGKDEDANSVYNNDIEYRDRNNTVGIYLSEDGKIYMRNRSFWNSFPSDKTGLDPAVEVDKLLFAVYPPEPSAKRNLLIRDFIGYFVNLVEREKVEEIQPWESEITIPPSMRRMPETIPIQEIAASIALLGGYFIDGILERYHVAMNHLTHKHFVILSGLSGTGKTSLAKSYAFAVHGLIKADSENPFFFICAVRPDWTDPTGLIGYHDVISEKYIVTPFLQAILAATAHKDTPVLVCIDEMNIARAEFYFADVLSSIESRMPLQLHANSVPLNGSSGEQIPSNILLPSNLFITGTINIDESTQPLSDKILDRANIIDLSSINMNGFFKNLALRYPNLEASINDCSPLLIQLDDKLLPHNLGFGYRIAEEFVRYYAFAKRTGVMAEIPALDSQIAQKIFVKLRGSEYQRDLLENLTRISRPYPRSLQIVEDLRQQLKEFGSFQYLR